MLIICLTILISMVPLDASMIIDKINAFKYVNTGKFTIKITENIKI